MTSASNVVVLSLALVSLLGCSGESRSSRGTSSDVVELPAEESVDEDSAFDWGARERAAFLGPRAHAARIGSHGHIALFDPQAATIVDRLRSSYPADHFLYELNEVGIDDRVLLRFNPGVLDSGAVFVIFTDGMSADPGFYSVRERDRTFGEVRWGEVLDVQTVGDAVLFQRTNSFFARRKPVRFVRGLLEEIPQVTEPVDLSTVALAEFALRRSPSDPTVVARVRAGDSVRVLEASHVDQRGGPIFRIAVSTGLTGWVRLPSAQCPRSLLRGICFNGD